MTVRLLLTDSNPVLCHSSAHVVILEVKRLEMTDRIGDVLIERSVIELKRKRTIDNKWRKQATKLALWQQFTIVELVEISLFDICNGELEVSPGVRIQPLISR